MIVWDETECKSHVGRFKSCRLGLYQIWYLIWCKALWGRLGNLYNILWSAMREFHRVLSFMKALPDYLPLQLKVLDLHQSLLEASICTWDMSHLARDISKIRTLQHSGLGLSVQSYRIFYRQTGVAGAAMTAMQLMKFESWIWTVFWICLWASPPAFSLSSKVFSHSRFQLSKVRQGLEGFLVAAVAANKLIDRNWNIQTDGMRSFKLFIAQTTFKCLSVSLEKRFDARERSLRKWRTATAKGGLPNLQSSPTLP